MTRPSGSARDMPLREFGRISRRLLDRGEPIRHEDGAPVKPPNGNNVRVPWLVILGLIFTLLGSGFAYLETKKADRTELDDYKKSLGSIITEMRSDVRDIRNALIGPAPARPNR